MRLPNQLRHLKLAGGKRCRFAIEPDERDAFHWIIDKHVREVIADDSECAKIVRAVLESGDSAFDRTPFVTTLDGL